MGSTTAKINKDTFTIRELTLREIRELTEISEGNPIDALCSLLTTATTAKPGDVIDLTPSELQEFVDKMLEVNAPFFSMAEAANMNEVAEALRGMIRSIFLTSLVSSLSEATE
jgi:hypothetical protein